MPAVLLDVDGTLVDTTYLHAVCWSEALAQHGHRVTTARLHRLVGMSAEKLLAEVGGPADATETHRALYAQHWGHLRPLRGARELLRALHDRGPVVLASSASPDELAALRQALEADDWIDAATSGGDVAQGKPAPDLLQQAIDLAGTDDVVMVGDAVWDGEASTRAGVPYIALLCGGTSEHALRKAGAVEVWADPQDLLDHLPSSILSTHNATSHEALDSARGTDA